MKHTHTAERISSSLKNLFKADGMNEWRAGGKDLGRQGCIERKGKSASS